MKAVGLEFVVEPATAYLDDGGCVVRLRPGQRDTLRAACSWTRACKLASAPSGTSLFKHPHIKFLALFRRTAFSP